MTEIVKKAEVSIDKHDVAAIVVSRVEQDLQTKLVDLEKQLRATEKVAKEAEKANKKALEDLRKEKWVPLVEAYRNAAKAVGVKADCDGRYELSDGNVKFCLGYHDSPVKFEQPQESKDAMTALKEAESRITEIATEIVSVKKQLGQIGAIERRARAAIAEHELTQSGVTLEEAFGKIFGEQTAEIVKLLPKI